MKIALIEKETNIKIDTQCEYKIKNNKVKDTDYPNGRSYWDLVTDYQEIDMSDKIKYEII